MAFKLNPVITDDVLRCSIQQKNRFFNVTHYDLSNSSTKRKQNGNFAEIVSDDEYVSISRSCSWQGPYKVHTDHLP